MRHLRYKVEESIEILRVSTSLNFAPVVPLLPHSSSCLGPTCLKDRKDKVVFTGSHELGVVSLGKRI